MKRDVSLGAAAAVTIAAVIGISSQYGGKPATDTSAHVNMSARAPTSVPSVDQSFSHGPCVEIEERLQTFLLNGSEESRAAPLSCYKLTSLPKDDKVVGERLRSEAQNLRFVIATLPDPVHSHFSLTFDRFAEAIQEGATDERYIYDSSWLPWDTNETPHALLQDQDQDELRKKNREEQPGILLFRKRFTDQPKNAAQPFREGLAVFVVGEEPTKGIHREQFENAAAWIASLQPRTNSESPEYELPNGGILGPTFSGSLPSLASLLDDLRSKPKGQAASKHSGRPLRVYSGSISGRRGVAWFTAVESELKGVRFASFQQNDDQMIGEYCSYLLQSNFDLHRLAIVSEDETAYGSEAAPDREHDKTGTLASCSSDPEHQVFQPTRIFYPRDISALRTAYQEQSIFNSQPAQSSAEAGRRTLSANIADPEGEQHDTIRNYNIDQTAQSQEAVLQQIVSQLREHQAEYILLRSSNPLDQIFLSHYFRMTYPQGRIVILGADLLLRRESGAARLSGIMTLTTYPLLPWEPHWTRNSDEPDFHSHRVYPQHSAEGAYIATRFLLHSWSIREGQILSIDALAAQMGAGGYTKREATSPLPPGSYSTTGQDLTVNPGSESYLPAGPLKIHLENNRVDSIKDNEGKPLPEFEFASELDLPNKEKFLPIDPRLQIPDYNTPFWLRDPHDHTFAMEQPPAWLSVLGRNDFWPLAALNCYSLSDATQNHGPPCIHTDPGIWETARRATESLGKTLAFWNAKTAYHEEQTEHNPSWAPMPLSMKVALCLLFIWASFHFVCCLLPSITAKPNHRAYFVCFSHSFRTHRALLVAGSLALSSTATVLAFGYGAMYREGPPLLHAVQCLALLPSLWLIAGSALVVNLWKLRSVRPLDRKGEFSEATAPPQGETESRRFQNRLSRVLPTPGWARSLTDYLAPRWPFLWPPLAYVAGTLGFYFWLYYSSERVLTFANRVPFYLRSMNLTNGVSPVVPIIALTVGAYMWVWHSLQGLAFFGPDVPALPTNASLQFPGEGKTMLDRLRMFSREHAGAPVEALCWPFARGIAYAFIAFLASMIVIAMVLSTRGEEPIRSLGARSYAQLLCLLVAASVSLMLANAWQLLHIWSRLRRLLVHLDRVPMRRSMAAFPGVSWGSVWKISGNVFDMRYKLLVSQLETLTHLQNSMATTKMSECAFWNGPRCYEKVDDAISRLQHTRNEFSKWYVENCDKTKVYGQEKLKTLQESLAEVAGQIVAWMLLPAWRMENEDLLPKVTSPVGEKADEEDENKSATGLQLAPHIRHAEKFVCFVYLGFIQNTLGRMRTLVVGVLCLFISSTISLASYPFDPRPVVNGAMVLLFLALGAAIVHVYAQMHRDPILSLVTNTKPGALDGDFWIKLVGFGAGPVIGLIATLFPQLTDFLFSWVAPGISSAK